LGEGDLSYNLLDLHDQVMVKDVFLQDIPQGPGMDQVLDATFPLWGEGLTRQAYGSWNKAQGLTPWGRANLSRVGLVRAGEVLASAKRYLFDARAGDRSLRVLGIGAVFTPESHRGQGLAHQLVEAVIADGRERGCDVALLFSEIGPEYYARMGFEEIPRSVLTLHVPRHDRLGAPATLVRAGEAYDLPYMAEMTARYAATGTFALERPASLIEFALMRRRSLAGLGPAGHRSFEFFVSEEGNRAASYVVISRGPGGVFLEECGDYDPTGARVGAMLEVLAAREPSEEDRTLRTWWPEGFRPPQIQVLSSAPSAEVMMVKTIQGDAPDYSRVVYWQSDIF
jgi:GNAT superfamily N-acetyltransferase